jgi:hypothetical protein
MCKGHVQRLKFMQILLEGSLGAAVMDGKLPKDYRVNVGFFANRWSF